MPDLPISGLPAASTLDGSELFATVQGGITKKTTLASMIYAPGSAYGLFNQTGSGAPVTNTLTETTLIGGGVGTLTVPANGFTQGDAYVVTLTGHISSVNNHTLQIRIKAGSVLLADTGVIQMPTITNLHWSLDVNFTVNKIGAAGVASISTGGKFLYTKNASVAYEGVNFSTENNTTFDTTTSNVLNITAQWGNTSTSDSIYTNICTLNKLY